MGAVTTAKWNHRTQQLILRLARGDQSRPLDLRKTTLGVDVQTVGLNAEKKNRRPADGEDFSLDIPFYRTSPVGTSIRLVTHKSFITSAALGANGRRAGTQVAFLLQPSMGPIGRLATGQPALRSTCSDVVPRRASRNPSGPSVVMMIRSARSSAAVCKMMSTTSPALAILFQVQSVSLGSFSEGISAVGPT